MNVIALPGSRAETESWLRSLLHESGLSDAGLVRYQHWSGGKDADADWEAEHLANSHPDVIIAKSFGTVVAALAFQSRVVRPLFFILIGTPFEAVSSEHVEALRNLGQSADALFIQQERDPAGPSVRLASTLGLPRDRVVEVPGNDHLYKEIPALSTAIRDWLSRLPH